jgi:hypothetical protein
LKLPGKDFVGKMRSQLTIRLHCSNGWKLALPGIISSGLKLEPLVIS